MIAELGFFSSILSLGLALVLMLLPAWGVFSRNLVLMQTGGSISAGLFVFLLISFVALTYAFVTDDFSVNYVAHNSNSALPIQYKVSAVWGAHEGSFLLWTLVLGTWTFAVALFSRDLTLDMRARVLSILGGLAVGFILFLLFTSNPFERSLPVFPSEGNDLNPLLQDFGLIVHPPMLYMGYVGFAVPFAFAIATLWSGRLDTAWARWSRPWTNIAWAFLTIGITLGSWWAYYELGWGGWWFWDPVENASFMPWLVGTALIHSLASTEKRGVFKTWTVLLAIAAFSFSLLGGFLVRSGVLTSVHAFAQDPQRGMYILIFLVIVIGSSLGLYAFRAQGIKSNAIFTWTSREALILVNNLLLVVATGAVLLGTLYPLAYEAVTGGDKLSVGPPYFATVFVPIVMVLFLFMAISPRSQWKNTTSGFGLRRQIIYIVCLLVAVGVLSLIFASFVLPVILITSIACWITINLVEDVVRRIRNKREKLRGMFSQPMAYYGMLLGHGGIVVSMIGICCTVYFSSEKDVRMVPGDEVSLGGYEFQFVRMRNVTGPNYVADQGEILVTHDGEEITTLYPEKRLYAASQSVMTEADMDPGIFRDLYVALGEPVGDSAWAVRVHVKPFVRWIWIGGLFVALGGAMAVTDKRYRSARRRVSNAEISESVA
ncbi:MAG: heme lyase NrfEFG subunit NrfE [Gammaproteobacteria bacterium]|nr:heme lyase NrfEFG subunit NrfE [Gammaproteobacteria bacterium]